MTSFSDRVIRAAKLDVSLYEEVEKDKEAIAQAMGVVVLSSVAAGIGSINVLNIGVQGILLRSVSALFAWFVWAWLTYLIGSRLLPEPQTEADVGELLRTIGFASAPGLIRVLGIIPGTAKVVFFVAAIWMLFAMIIAVRQALDYTSTFRAVGVCLIGWLIQLFLVMILILVIRADAPIGGMATQ